MVQPSSGNPPATSRAKYAAVTIAGGPRSFAWAVSVIAIVVGVVLAFMNRNGISTAAVVAVGLLFGVVAVSGMMPASIKVGDVEIMLQRAKEEGMAEGAFAAVTATAKIAALQLEPGDALEDMPVPMMLKPMMKYNLNLVHKAALSEPEPWRKAMTSGTEKPDLL